MTEPTQNPAPTSDARKRHNPGVQIEGGDSAKVIDAYRIALIVVSEQRDKLTASLVRLTEAAERTLVERDQLAAQVARVRALADAGDVRTLDDFREPCVMIDDLTTALDGDA